MTTGVDNNNGDNDEGDGVSLAPLTLAGVDLEVPAGAGPALLPPLLPPPAAAGLNRGKRGSQCSQGHGQGCEACGEAQVNGA